MESKKDYYKYTLVGQMEQFVLTISTSFQHMLHVENWDLSKQIHLKELLMISGTYVTVTCTCTVYNHSNQDTLK